MARVLNLDTAAEDIRKNLARSIQSANLNFLIGSGASYPAIPIAGSVQPNVEITTDGDPEPISAT